MKIATWNINSINVRKEQVIKWLKEEKPNIALLQELKCAEASVPKEEIEDLGYNIAMNCQKAFNGVAILSLHPIEEVITNFPENPIPDQARYLEAVISFAGSILRVASIYVPNGQIINSEKYQTKLKFLYAFYEYCKTLLKLDEKIIIGGDFNVAPEDIDSFSPDETMDSVLFHIDARNRVRSILNLGFYDAFRVLHPTSHEFSWWDYRSGAWQRNHGMLIDHILLSPEAADSLDKAYIMKDMRALEKASDHVPVLCELKS